MPRRRKLPKVHHSDLSKASHVLTCGVRMMGDGIGRPNYAFNPDKVTCKRCIKILKTKGQHGHEETLSGTVTRARARAQQ